MEFTDKEIENFFDTLKEKVLKENKGAKRIRIAKEPIYSNLGHADEGLADVIVANRFIVEIGA